MRRAAMFLVAAIYLAAGLVFGALAGAAASREARVGWRFAAWAISAVAFAAHVWFEQVRRRTVPSATALRASLAVALGAFGLAVAASVHGRTVHRPFPAWALVVWPVATALPAFVVALAAASLLAALQRRTTG